MRRGVVPLGGRATRRRWRRRENGGLARNKSFFQKTLEAARGAFWRGLGRGGARRLDGRWRWCDGVEGRGWRVIGGAVVGRGCREGAEAQGERGQALAGSGWLAGRAWGPETEQAGEEEREEVEGSGHLEIGLLGLLG